MEGRLVMKRSMVEDELDMLVVQAARGDVCALGEIEVVLGPLLREEARVVLGEYADEDESVLQELLEFLGDWRSRFRPAHGRAVVWMCRAVRAISERRRRGHAWRWRDAA
jgi:hypothetical protein